MRRVYSELKEKYVSRGRQPKTKQKNNEQERIEANREAATAAFESLRTRRWWGGSGKSNPAAKLLTPLLQEMQLVTKPGARFAANVRYGAIDPLAKQVFLNPFVRERMSRDNYLFVLAHLALHLGLEHHLSVGDLALQAARERVVDTMLGGLALGTPPADYVIAPISGDTDEMRLAAVIAEEWTKTPPAVSTMAGLGVSDVETAPGMLNYSDRLAEGLQQLLTARLDELRPEDIAKRTSSLAEEARRYIINRYPLLGARAARIKIITDSSILNREHIHIAAVNPALGEIYLNLHSNLSLREAVYVLAHELLHLGLRHGDRLRGRDPFVWNLAADFAIAIWLNQMAVGVAPQDGLMYDPTLAGMSTEAIYDLLMTQPGKLRRVRTLRGMEMGDVILTGPRTLLRGDVSTFEDAYAEALKRGLEACRLRYGASRGLVPADLVEEIDSLDVDPIPWDVELAHWFEEFVPAVQARRTYARASRRQSASPDIPRPRYYYPEETVQASTFGVILDTSASMDRTLLAKSLGAIASYAEARGVKRLRLVHCDAMPYDDGYVDPQDLRQQYSVKGRGGTVLQMAVNYLLAQEDFPTTAPVLLISDGYFESDLQVPREHAFVLPTADPYQAVPAGRVFRPL